MLESRMSGRLRVLVVISVLTTVPVWGSEKTRVQEQSAPYILQYTRIYNVPVELDEAVIEVESGWNPRAVSRKGAQGLMQLMPDTASRCGIRDRFDIQQNIRCGTAYLGWLIRMSNGDLRLALGSYQAGEKAVLTRGLAYSSREVFQYVTRVGQIYRALLNAPFSSITHAGPNEWARGNP